MQSEERVTVSSNQIHAFLRAGGTSGDRARVGPFMIRTTPHTDHPMLNYAIPDDGVCPSTAAVKALVNAFEHRGLTPRLEYAHGSAPDLEPVLLAEGFRTEAHLPLMVCRPGEARLIEASASCEVVLAQSDRDHADALVVANEAYGEPAGPPAPEAVTGRQRIVAAGGAVALARHLPTADPAGSGLCAVPHGGVSELAAIGTAVAFRKRGVAAAVTARLVRHAFESGLSFLWLTPEHEEGERIYSRVGFVRSGDHMIHISRPSP
jgi:GNAT superfamily N-acetyltransferase